MTSGTRDEAPSPLQRSVENFRASIAPDLYKPETFVPWPWVDSELERLGEGTLRIQDLVDSRALDANGLASALAFSPKALDVIRNLLIAPMGAGFSDGRELPDDDPPGTDWVYSAASLAIDLGLPKLVPHGSRVEDLLRLSLIAVDSRRRGFRRRDNIEGRTSGILSAAISEVEQRLGLPISSVPLARQPAPARGRVRAVVAADGVPVAAVATVFQAQTGGRQQRDLAVTYPRLQEELDSVPMGLILIADGRGLADTPRRVLELLFESTGACMTVGQAEEGALTEALEAAVRDRGVRQTRRSSAIALIERALERRPKVAASELPVAADAALLAMGQFASDHPELALDIEQYPPSISWVSRAAVGEAQDLVDKNDARGVARLLATLLGLTDVHDLESSSPTTTILAGTTPADRVLPRTLVVAASTQPVTEELVRDVARVARSASAEASVAALASPRVQLWRGQPLSKGIQQSLATSVVVLEWPELVRLAGATNTRDAFIRFVLEQADLTKANPFTSMGATPRAMFFGRTTEAATLRATLRTNSAALIGGRRIGKTSLMQRLVDDLRDDGWQPFYADLQESGDWRTFASLVSLRWQVDIPLEFAPSHLSRLVGELGARGQGRIVILLDEIDHLLRWDLAHEDGSVPEAFFRACRALSQEGAAQFVFSGERLVSERLWDPRSPHWNFCKPIAVKQLSRQAADSLLVQPLEDLGVIFDAPRSLDEAWSRTQGHPQLTQFLGSKLVEMLNALPADERSLIPESFVSEVTKSLEYRQHYCETYWGQSTDAERLISAIVASGVNTTALLRKRLRVLDVDAREPKLNHALRMLDLYGVLESPFEPLQLRASWLGEAMQVFGGAEAVITDYADKARHA